MTDENAVVGLSNAIRLFFTQLAAIATDETWGWAMNEMSEDVNRNFNLVLDRLRQALALYGRGPT